MRTLLARITVMTSALALGGMEANAAGPTDTGPTRLALSIGPQATEHPGKSGIYALPDPRRCLRGSRDARGRGRPDL